MTFALSLRKIFLTSPVADVEKRFLVMNAYHQTIELIMNSEPIPPSSGKAATLRCSFCARPIRDENSNLRPFCSERCQHLDLANWLDERYGLPWEAEDDEQASDEK